MVNNNDLINIQLQIETLKKELLRTSNEEKIKRIEEKISLLQQKFKELLRVKVRGGKKK